MITIHLTYLIILNVYFYTIVNKEKTIPCLGSIICQFIFLWNTIFTKMSVLEKKQSIFGFIFNNGFYYFKGLSY